MTPVFRHKKLLLGIYISYAVHYFLKQEPFYPKLFKCYLGDILCMPIVLSTSLILMSLIYFKKYAFLSTLQISIATALFSLYFELLLPYIDNTYVQDPVDVLCYASGGFVYGLAFNPRKQFEQKSSLA